MRNYDLLAGCFHQALGVEATCDLSSLRYQSLSAWDSVGHMRLVAAIETCFDIMFTTDQILDMSSFEKAVEILGHHGITVES